MGLDCVADSLVELDNALVMGTNLYVEFWASHIREQSLGLPHNLAAITSPLMSRIHRDMVDPAAESIIATEECSHHDACGFSDQKKFPLPLELPADHGCRFVAWWIRKLPLPVDTQK